MKLKSTLKEHKTFFLLHTLFFLIASLPVVLCNNLPLFLQLNSLHHPYLDLFFDHVTFFGSIVAYLLFIGIIVVRCNGRTVLTAVSSFVAMSAVVHGLKRLFFSDQLRPIALVPADFPLHLIEGVVPSTHLSFPSGHAATIFTIVCLIRFLVRRKHLGLDIMLLLLATAVAYSMVYLSYHFYRDIYVGALIGTWTTTLVWLLVMRWKGPDWLDKKLPELLLGRF